MSFQTLFLLWKKFLLCFKVGMKSTILYHTEGYIQIKKLIGLGAFSFQDTMVLTILCCPVMLLTDAYAA